MTSDESKQAIDSMKLNNSKWDILIGNYGPTPERTAVMNFTLPIYLNTIHIMHEPTLSHWKVMTNVLVKYFLFPLILLVIIGGILGHVLYLVDPQRGKRRAVFSSIASMFGEMGYVSERSNLKPIAVVTAFIIMVISYYYTIFLQAFTTGDVIKQSKEIVFTVENLQHKKILTPKNWIQPAKYFKDNWGLITHDPVHADKMVEYYLDNTDKYDGFSIDFFDMIKIQKEYPRLVYTESFGYDAIAWPVHRRNTDLVRQISIVLGELRNKHQIYNICMKNLGQDSHIALLCQV